MDYFHALILAVVEGITEFLPISSTGHLILAAQLLDIEQTDFVKSFEIIIQLGAIFSVVFLYWKTLLTKVEVWKRVLVAFLPTAVIGLTFYKIVKDMLLGNSLVTVIALFVGGVVLIALEQGLLKRKSAIENIEKIPLKTAFLIGLFQSISLIPGVSRAAATIVGGMLLKIERKTAVEFSFLLAVPTMLAATVLDVVKTDFSFSTNQLSLLAIGFIGSFAVALFAVKFLLRFVEHNTFVQFGIYRIIVALLFLLFIS